MDFSFKTFTFRKILVLFLVAETLAGTFSIVAAKRLSSSTAVRVRNQEIYDLIRSIETGPLAFARLQSANFAQDQLDRLMNNSDYERRGILNVRLRGGENGVFTYAQWGKLDEENSCVASVSRTVTYPGALNPFIISITIDKCVVLPEQKQMLQGAVVSVIAILLMTTFAFLVAIWPILNSINVASGIVKGGGGKRS